MALFSWKVIPKHRPSFGDLRTITKFVIWKRIGNEVRVCGFESIIQEYRTWKDCSVRGPYTVRGWRDKDWA